MIRFATGGALAVGIVLAAATDKAAAQIGPNTQANPYVRPAVSPYLNLNQGGNLGTNYYALVKPQINTARQLQNLQQQITQQQTLMPQLGAPAAEEDGLLVNYAVTGHPSTFSNTGHFFGQAAPFTRPNQAPLPITKR
jgi:hypothetical protein